MAIIKKQKKISQYGKELREKQELKKIYGIRENQMKRYVEEASRIKGNTAENLFILLERRLDNIVYRLGLAKTRPHARQHVSHGHFTVNDKKVTIPSFLVKPGDKLKPKNPGLFQTRENIELGWIKLIDRRGLIYEVLNLPLREDIDTPIDENIVMQFYKR